MENTKSLLTTNDLKVLSALDNNELYGLQIRNEILASGSNLFLGSLYNILSRLEDQGLVVSRFGAAGGSRGEHRRRYYKLTSEGKIAVDSYRQQFLNLWKLNEAIMEN